MGDERRTHKRFDVQPLICRTHPRLYGISVLRNVSLQGAFLLNGEPPPIGTSCELEFAEPPLSGYRLRGQVVRHGSLKLSRGYAIDFISPHPRLLRAVYHQAFAS